MRGLRLHVSLGDPRGVGPELLARSLVDYEGPEPVVHGHPEVLARLRTLGLPVPGQDLPAQIRPPADWPPDCDPFAHPGLAARRALEDAVDLAVAGQVDALVTGPVDKARLLEAGFSAPGHTDYLAARSGVDVAMLFVAPTLRVAPATLHVPLSEVPRILSRDRLLRVLRVLARSLCRDFGISAPRVAVAGLNPHAGEGGQLGRQELEVIAPALEQARKWARQEGLMADFCGPLPADTVFVAARRGDFDAVVTAYHDQAMIPVKLLAFDSAVNVTVGLPYVRTSPAHGTAEDIAWTGRARAGSFRAALDLALRLAQARLRRAAA